MKLRLLAVVFLIAALSACGGSDSDVGQKLRELEGRVARLEELHPTPTPTSTSTPTPTAAQAEATRQAGEDEARRAEFHDVTTAVKALMLENSLTIIPVPYVGNDSPCTTGTQDMTKFPDDSTTVASKQAQLGGAGWAVGDGLGYQLYAHDMVGNASTTSAVNYVNFNRTRYCYKTDVNGTVHQYNTAGVEQQP